jgi:hypothetical protein
MRLKKSWIKNWRLVAYFFSDKMTVKKTFWCQRPTHIHRCTQGGGEGGGGGHLMYPLLNILIFPFPFSETRPRIIFCQSRNSGREIGSRKFFPEKLVRKLVPENWFSEFRENRELRLFKLPVSLFLSLSLTLLSLPLLSISLLSISPSLSPFSLSPPSLYLPSLYLPLSLIIGTARPIPNTKITTCDFFFSSRTFHWNFSSFLLLVFGNENETF